MTDLRESDMLAWADICLNMWGTWAAAEDPARKIGYPRMTPYERLVRKTMGGVVTDEIPERVDSVIGTLTQDEQELARLVYVRKYPVKYIREKLHIGQGIYNRRIYGIKRVVYQEIR